MAVSMPAVSVIIPVYNRMRWLVEAVESVLAQTFADFEVIVVDDGSSEPMTLPVGIAADARVRSVRQPHRGASAARNQGIASAKGRLIAFLDSDDLFLPHKLERQVDQMARRPDVCFSHTSYLTMNSGGQEIRTIESGGFGGRVYPLIVTQCPIATPTVMIRREALRELKFDESVYPGEDLLLWTQLARRGEVLGIQEPLTAVRMHGDNAADDLEKQVETRIYLLRRAMAEDPALGARFGEAAIAKVHWDAAKAYVKRFRPLRAVSCMTRAWAAAVGGRVGGATRRRAFR